MSLRDELLPVADAIRAIPEDFGIRRYSLAILTRIPNASPDARLVLTPAPRVRIINTVRRHVNADVQISLDNFAYQVGPITPAYCEPSRSALSHAGNGTGTLTAARSIPVHGVTPGPWALLLTVTASGSPGGSAAFTYSIDGGTTTTGPVAMLASFQVPGIGLALTFNGPFVSGDSYVLPGVSGGYTPNQLRPQTTSPEVTTLYELAGDEGSFLATLIRIDFDRAEHATIYLHGGRLFT